MIIMRSKTLTSQKCKLCYQCFFRKIGDNYARDDKLCQHNLSKPKRRSATRSELCLRLTFSDFPSPGRTSKADMWIVSDCSLSRFVWIFVAETQVCRRGDADRSPISVPDYIYRVIYASFSRFQIFFKTESFFSISLSLSLFFFFLKKQNKTKQKDLKTVNT